MRHGILSRLLACVLAAAGILSPQPFSVNAQSAEDSQQTVKVGVLNNTTYAYQDQDGVWRGIDVECMISIAQKAGFNVEFIDSSLDPDFLGNLENGTYDAVADVVRTAERQEKYLFTDESIGSMNNTLAVRADDSRWDYGNIDQVSGMKIGVLATYANNADFRKWCTKHQVTPEIIEYGNIDEMTSALRNKEIDGEVYSAISGDNYTEEFRTIMKFLPESYSFAFRKDDVELKNEVDTAIAQILAGDSEYFTNLKNKYETQYRNNILPLSSAESAFISANPTIRAAAVKNDAPYYKEGSGGTVSGIIPDYYKLLEKWTGLKFEFTIYPTYEEAIAAVQCGEADMLGMYRSGLIDAYQNGLSLTGSISDVSCILLTNSGTDISSVKNIGAGKESSAALKTGFERIFPDAEMIQYANAGESFSALKSGSTDAALMGLYSATWLLNQTNSGAYSVVPVSGISYEICAAVPEDNQMLCSILSKGIAATRGNFSGIATKDTMPEGDLNSAIARIPSGLIIAVVLVLLVLVIGLIWAITMLNRRQRERTAILKAQAETEKEKARLEEIEKNAEDRSRFFANISHDMRTPLNAILGFASLARKDGIGEEQRLDYISKIQTSGTLLLDLINDTLTLSKVNSGKLEINTAPVRASDMFESVIVTIREAAAKKNITFTADYSAARDRTILADELNVRKILLNLLSNAVKFTPEGGHVSLLLYNDPPEGRDPDSMIKVTDDGIGISPEFLPHVFEPFVQEKQAGYEAVGTGLGLSIVKQLVNLMGGTIQVESEKGKGTVFTVRLHFQDADRPLPDRGGGNVKSDAEFAGVHVLLCEDNALNREIAVALLKDKGMLTDTAENGEIGVRKFRESAVGYYQIILMDVRMPVMNGYETTAKIRLLDREDAGTVPIIAMTADAFSDDIQRCLDAGMDDHIAKPIDQQKMLDVLGRHLS